MKIVIDSGNLGFSLSHEGILRFAELGGVKLYFKTDEFGYTWYYTTENLDENSLYFFNTYDSEFRRNLNLIQVINELGDRANGEYAKLKVVEIPEGIEFGIGMPDYGSEWIYEQHRTWR